MKKYFLRVPAVRGSSKDPQHEGWIPIVSYALTKTTPTGRAVTSTEVVTDAEFETPDAQGLSNLFRVWSGSGHVGTVTLDIVADGPGKRSPADGQYIFTDSVVTSIQQSGILDAMGGFALNFTKVELRSRFR